MQKIIEKFINLDDVRPETSFFFLYLWWQWAVTIRFLLLIFTTHFVRFQECAFFLVHHFRPRRLMAKAKILSNIFLFVDDHLTTFKEQFTSYAFNNCSRYAVKSTALWYQRYFLLLHRRIHKGWCRSFSCKADHDSCWCDNG